MKSILVYSAIGNTCNFFKDWSCGRDENFVCAYTYYGDNEDRKNEIERECSYFYNQKGTKYSLFSKIVDNLPLFDYYAILDDDLNLTSDQIKYMVSVMDERNYGVGSPSYSDLGKCSGWLITNTRSDSKQRDSVFVEMGAIIFNREEMFKFLQSFKPYEDVLIGWGIDHIVHSVCRHPFIIFDEISVINPTNEQKNIERREIETYCPDFRTQEYKSWCEIRDDKNNTFKQYGNNEE
jgi:hypothetical protein